MHTIDAQEKSLGRVASEAASVLRGKNSPEFAPNKIPTVMVKVVNASKLSISEKKAEQKTYTHYTGHPGGLREQSLGRVIATKGHAEVIKRAVKGMLPANKLRRQMLKNLIIEA